MLSQPARSKAWNAAGSTAGDVMRVPPGRALVTPRPGAISNDVWKSMSDRRLCQTEQ